MVITIATTIAILLFFYFQDENREPPKRVIEAFIVGAVISLQVSFLQAMLPYYGILFAAFVAAGVIEEGVKLAALRLTLFRNPNFTKAVDGITYAVFLSLGFALVENIVHVTQLEIGVVRAFTATPAHALFAVSMGYWLGKYRFSGNKRHFLYALIIPVGLHGVYNYLIMSGQLWGVILFAPYIIFLWWLGMLKFTKLNERVKRNVDKVKKLG